MTISTGVVLFFTGMTYAAVQIGKFDVEIASGELEFRIT